MMKIHYFWNFSKVYYGAKKLKVNLEQSMVYQRDFPEMENLDRTLASVPSNLELPNGKPSTTKRHLKLTRSF